MTESLQTEVVLNRISPLGFSSPWWELYIIKGCEAHAPHPLL